MSFLVQMIKKSPLIKIKRKFWDRKMNVAFHRFISFIPDRTFLTYQYKKILKRKPNIDNPQRFSEKMLWYKLYWRHPLMTQCSDKYAVREYVKSKGLESILNELYGVYDTPNEIDFDTLPNQFILKTNNGSATNIICLDKSKLDIKKTKKELQYYLDIFKGPTGTYTVSRSWGYHNIKPKIIAESLITDPLSHDGSLTDYKFVCFNGKVEYYYIVKGRYADETITWFDRSGNFIDVCDCCLPNDPKSTPPQNIEEMIKKAEILAQEFPYVRVDFYNINGKIYFGELTFYDSGGNVYYKPDEFDITLGEKFILPPKYPAK